MLCRGEAKVKVEDVLGLKVKYNYEVSGISIDSRKTKKNDIFICIDGENVSGNDFIDELIKKKVRTFVTNNIDIYKKYVNEKLIIQILIKIFVWINIKMLRESYYKVRRSKTYGKSSN